MPISISRAGAGRYQATVTPPHGRGAYWRTPAPMPVDELVERLRNLGCHTTDISDAFLEADPLWMERTEQDRDDRSG